ncbi:MAG: cytochrome c biogenesis protein CcsA [Deltaproteobacteria bacterium]|nr:cytochrome c biogenesis protein CcsA [Deltaproteobacteria bacterium]
MYKILLIIALHLLFVSGVAHVWLLLTAKKRRPFWEQTARWSTVGACATLTIALLLVHLMRDARLFSTSADLFVFLSLSTVGLYLIFYNRFHTRTIGAIAVPLAALHLTLGLITQERQIEVAERATVLVVWTTVHVAAAAIGAGLFSIAAIASGLYAFQDRRLRNRHSAPSHIIPPLDTLDRINRLGINWGYVLFSGGLALGIIKVFVIRRIETFSDPFTVVFVLCWLLYTGLLVARSTGSIGARRAALGSIVCFAVAFSGFMSAKLVRGVSGDMLFHGTSPSQEPKQPGAPD